MRGSELMWPYLRFRGLVFWVLEVGKHISVTCCPWGQVGEGSFAIWGAKQIVFGLNFGCLL